MKHTIMLLVITITTMYNGLSQSMYYSTNYKQECWWNATTQKYDNCTGSDESSLFKLNADKTMFHHTTASISSDYYVTKHEYDNVNDVETYDVKSDVGNSYFFIIDTKNNQVRIVGNNKTSDDKTYMHVYTIKKSWTE